MGQVGAAERREAGRGQPIEAREQPYPQPGEHAQGGVVAGEPLDVPEHATADAERADRHDRDHEVQDRWVQRGTRNQPGGGGHQADARAGRPHAGHSGQYEATGRRTRQGDQQPQPAGHRAGSSSGAARRTSRSASAANSGR
jgi:hypothetical protein